MMEILQIAGSLGVGAFLGLIIFLMYRRDVKSWSEKLREDRKFMEDRLSNLLEEDRKAREKNTKTLTKLTTLLVRLNGKLGK